MKFTDFLEEQLGQPKENTIGEMRFCCPFCGERKYKFYVHNSLSSKDGLYHCKKCDAVGNPVTFMKEYYKVDGKTAYDMLENRNIVLDKVVLREYANSELTEEERMLLMLNGIGSDTEEKQKTPPPLPVGFKLLRDNMNNPEAYPFLNYLHGRGITLEQIYNHSIAYIVDGYCVKDTPLGTKTITIRNSIVFFTYDISGDYLYWNTRSIEKNPYIKSINAPGQDTNFGKRDVIFNLNNAYKKSFIVITEGVFDALTFHEYGVATFGKQVTEEQLNLIRRYILTDTTIYVMLDSDALEQNIKLASELYITHKNTYVVPHGDEDANDLGTEKAFKLIKDNRVKASPEGLSSYYLKQNLW